MEPMEPIFDSIIDTATTGETPGSFTIDGEAEKRDHLANAVLHCYILISVGLINDSLNGIECCDGEILLRSARD
jgi:hypothetical protein